MLDPDDRDELDLLDVVGPRPGRSGALFALKVQGEQMTGEGILDGDYLLMERVTSNDQVREGDRVVAIIPNGDTVLKTFYRAGDGLVRLTCMNAEQRLDLAEKDLKVQGIVRSVLRRY